MPAGSAVNTIVGGTLAPAVTVSPTEPASPASGAFWLDTTDVPGTFKIWNGAAWAEIATTGGETPYEALYPDDLELWLEGASLSGGNGALVATWNNDSAGSASDATAAGAARPTVLVESGLKSARFNGTAQYLSCDPHDLGSDATVFMRLRLLGNGTPDVGGVVDLLTNLNAGSNEGWSLGVDVDTDKLDLYVANNGGYGTEDLSTGSLTRDTWHDVAVTYDGANKKIYIDGALDSTHASTVNGTSSSALTIGARPSASRYANIDVKRVLIYSPALTGGEIAALS